MDKKQAHSQNTFSVGLLKEFASESKFLSYCVYSVTDKIKLSLWI